MPEVHDCALALELEADHDEHICLLALKGGDKDETGSLYKDLKERQMRFKFKDVGYIRISFP